MTCYKCPEDWRFHHSVSIQRFLGADHPIGISIKDAESIYDIPLRLRKLHKDSRFLYKDEQFVIVNDPFPDFKTHLLVIPVEHIESTEIFNYPELFKDMLLAGWFIADNISSTDELSLKLSCKSVNHKNNYFKHFHLHIQSEDFVDEDELVKLFTPKFYKGHTPNG